jgi:hypothetical protein
MREELKNAVDEIRMELGKVSNLLLHRTASVDVLCHTYSNLVHSLLCSLELTSAPCNLFRKWLKRKPLFQQVVIA